MLKSVGDGAAYRGDLFLYANSVHYYYFASDQQVWLMTIYGKDEAADLTPKQKRALKAAVDAESKARQAKQPAREAKSRSKQ